MIQKFLDFAFVEEEIWITVKSPHIPTSSNILNKLYFHTNCVKKKHVFQYCQLKGLITITIMLQLLFCCSMRLFLNVSKMIIIKSSSKYILMKNERYQMVVHEGMH